MRANRWSVSKVTVWAAIFGAIYAVFNLLLSEDLPNGNLASEAGRLFGNIAGSAVGAAIIAGGFVSIRNLLVGRGR